MLGYKLLSLDGINVLWGTHALTSHFFCSHLFCYVSPFFDNCYSLAYVATFALSTSFHQYLAQDLCKVINLFIRYSCYGKLCLSQSKLFVQNVILLS